MNANRKLLHFCAVVFIVLLSGCDPGPRDRQGTDPVIIQENHYRNLLEIYRTFSYDWDDLEQGVPPLVLRRFPTDIHLIRPTAAKKEFFFQSILPMALLGNQEIREQRKTVQNLLERYDRVDELAFHQHEELIKIQEYYKVSGDILQDQNVRERLLRRIDIIPPALILAQAANESGWGMSRFAQHANNIFGEWTFTPGTGIVPEGRPEGETYEVRRFRSLYASIRSYLRNLNTHRAYRSMRNTRYRLRKNGLQVTGYTLAGDMQYYSTRRQAYVQEIRAIIAGNQLGKLNDIDLLPTARRPGPDTRRPPGGLMSSREKISRESQP